MSNQEIHPDKAVKFVTEEFDRLGITGTDAYTTWRGGRDTITRVRRADVRGPKGKRTVSLFCDKDGLNPRVLVHAPRYELAIRPLCLADIIKLRKIPNSNS